MKATILSILLLLLTPASAASLLHFTSSPESWVGNGQTFTATSSNSTITAEEYNGSYGLLIGVQSADHWWFGIFTAEQGQTLRVGEYPGASRFSIHGQASGPGIDFFGDGRGNNNTSGHFTVLEFEKSGNEITKIAIDFIQHDEQAPSAWVHGYFRFNSTLPVPEPSSFALLAGVTGIVVIRRKPKHQENVLELVKLR